MGRRTLLLVSSILIAAVGTALVAIYVRGAEQRAEQGASLVTVLVATKRVETNQSVRSAIESASFDTARVLQRERATDALTNPTQLQPLASENQVAVGPILPGQVIQRAMFSKSATVGSTGLDRGQMRLAVQLNDPNRSAGFLESGSNVAVFFTAGEAQAQQTRLLLDSVTVLSVGATVQRSRSEGGGGDAAAGAASSAEEEPVPTTIVSLAVTQDQAQKLIFAQKAGELYFAILQTGEKAQPSQPATKLRDILP